MLGFAVSRIRAISTAAVFLAAVGFVAGGATARSAVAPLFAG